jgi:RNA-directed DNA polymerase
LGISTVADRIAQTAVKMWLQPQLDPIFCNDPYGYRPGKSALEAIAVTRRRCWDCGWVVEFDIRGLFDNLDHDLLRKALRKHCQEPWIVLYVERWLKAPMQTAEGQILERDQGTPQGGVVSPILANLFLHYAFDLWVTRHLPGVWFADDAVLHCKSQRQEEYVLDRVRERFHASKLELHPGKTRIVYCKDINRNGDHPDVKFTFLGYTFRPRKAVDKYGRIYVNFTPAVSRGALKAMRHTIRGWHLQLKSDKSLDDLLAMFGPILKGWHHYYGHFYGSALKPVWRHVNLFLIRWLMRKYERLADHKTRAAEMLKQLAKSRPGAFVYWSLGFMS